MKMSEAESGFGGVGGEGGGGWGVAVVLLCFLGMQMVKIIRVQAA